MIDAGNFLEGCRDAGFELFTGVPCSRLAPLVDAVARHEDVRWHVAANEGDAVALAAGATLGRRPSAVLLQNSGLGNAVNALTSLCHPFRIPLLLLVGHRGRPDGPPDEAQHRLMGRITTDLLEAMEIGWEPFPTEAEAVGPTLTRATDAMEATERSYALVVPEGAFAPLGEQERSGGAPDHRRLEKPETSGRPTADARSEPFRPAGNDAHVRSETPGGSGRPLRPYDQRMTRREVLEVVLRHEGPRDILIGTTGYTGRELHDLADGPARLYMVGSMGSASALGLGLALARPDRRIVVLDGDGAVLMRMGNLAAVAAAAPADFLHLVLDNEAHESTGAQPRVGGDVRFAAVAHACGYPAAVSTDDAGELDRLLADPPEGPTLVHVRIRTGTPPDLGRPSLAPHEVKARLRAHLSLPTPPRAGDSPTPSGGRGGGGPVPP